jgi:hypothetical protein
MKYVIYKWYKLAKRYGFIPVLFTPVNKKRAYSYFKSMSIKLNTFYSTSKQDISKIFGIDLVPHCYFLGRDKEVLYSGHPDHISKRILYKISRL